MKREFLAKINSRVGITSDNSAGIWHSLVYSLVIILFFDAVLQELIATRRSYW